MIEILAPIITEKALSQVSEGRYIFKVLVSANKVQIAKAIQDIFKVKVVKVNVIRVKDETKLSRGKYKVKIKGYKKAIVTLKKGDKISGFEAK